MYLMFLHEAQRSHGKMCLVCLVKNVNSLLKDDLKMQIVIVTLQLVVWEGT